jgi:hypothetical protein
MSEQFDELAKALAKGTSRRSAIRIFLSGIGAALAGVFLSGGTAQAGGKKKPKPPQKDRCKDFCEKYYGCGTELCEQCCEQSEECTDSCCAFCYSVNSTEAEGTWTCVPCGAD